MRLGACMLRENECCCLVSEFGVHGVYGGSPVPDPQYVLDHELQSCVGSCVGGANVVGGADDVGELPVGVFGGVRAFGVPEGVPEVGFPPDVQCCSRDSPLLEGGVEGLLLDDGGSGDVHDERGGLHQAYLGFPDHASGLGGEGDGDHDDVGLLHHVV